MQVPVCPCQPQSCLPPPVSAGILAGTSSDLPPPPPSSGMVVSGSPCNLRRAVLSVFSTTSRSFPCVNDDNTTDIMGRTCSEIENDRNFNFDTRPYCQGDFDDSDFRASIQCCRCDPAGVHSFLYSNGELVNQFRSGPGPDFVPTFGASMMELDDNTMAPAEILNLKYRLGSQPSTPQLSNHDPADWRFSRGLLASSLPIGCTRAPPSVGRPSKASALAEMEASGRWVTWRGLDVVFSTSANRTMLMLTATAATRASDRHKIKGRVLVDGQSFCQQVRLVALALVLPCLRPAARLSVSLTQPIREQAGSDLKQITLSCAHATMLDTGLHRIEVQYKTTHSSVVAVEALQMDLVTCAAAASASSSGTATSSSGTQQQRPRLNEGMDFPSASDAMGSSTERFARSYSGSLYRRTIKRFTKLDEAALQRSGALAAQRAAAVAAAAAASTQQAGVGAYGQQLGADGTTASDTDLSTTGSPLHRPDGTQTSYMGQLIY